MVSVFAYKFIVYSQGQWHLCLLTRLKCVGTEEHAGLPASCFPHAQRSADEGRHGQSRSCWNHRSSASWYVPQPTAVCLAARHLHHNHNGHNRFSSRPDERWQHVCHQWDGLGLLSGVMFLCESFIHFSCYLWLWVIAIKVCKPALGCVSSFIFQTGLKQVNVKDLQWVLDFVLLGRISCGCLCQCLITRMDHRRNKLHVYFFFFFCLCIMHSSSADS